MIGKRVLVIGAGVGGISAAARLAKQGYEVTVVEKNKQPGGRCNFFERDGHSFDTGPTLFMMPEFYSRAFSDLGEDMEDHLELLRVDPTYKVVFHDKSELVMTSDKESLSSQMERIEKGSYEALQRYLEEGESTYKDAIHHLVDRQFNSIFDFFSPRNIYLAFKLNMFRKHYGYMGKFFRSDRLKEAFTFQDAYIGLNPFDAPAMFSMMSYLELLSGVWIPKGGMYSFVKSMTSLAEKFGARFLYNSPVKSIDVDEKMATGVTLENGKRIEADIVLANADLTYVYDKLLTGRKAAKKILNKRFTCSAITFYWGVSKRYDQLETHNLFVSGDYKRNFDEVTNKITFSDDPSFYIHAPSRTDSSRAPKGQDTLMVIIPVGHMTKTSPKDWKTLRERAREIVFERLDGIGITDIKENIKFEVSHTAEDWLNLYNLTNGSTLGLYHDLMQMGYLRPGNRHGRYRNLYFAGASTHPGSGVPMALISARLACERIIKEI